MRDNSYLALRWLDNTTRLNKNTYHLDCQSNIKLRREGHLTKISIKVDTPDAKAGKII